MQNIKTMSLTTKEIEEINNLDAQKAIEVMHECVERLGLVTVDEYSAVMCQNRRTVYQAAKDNKILKFELSGHIFLAVNDR